MIRTPCTLAAALLCLFLLPPPGAAAPTPAFDVGYDVLLLPGDGLARITIALDGQGLPSILRFRIDPRRHVDFTGTGEIEMEKGRLVWRVPKSGGKLRYNVRIDHDRNGPGKDAAITDSWALFRGEDLFPTLAVTTEAHLESNATLTMHLPEEWSVVTPWKRLGDNTFEIEQEHRYVDRPTGWVLAGRLGVTREKVAGIHFAIANPWGHGLHRLDILALLRWTLDDLVDVFPEHPERFAIVGAADPMWRGGLSGPDSLYLHAERPLIQSDGTSPILHELVHSFMHAKAGKDGDWIVEGIAEYYSLALLRRSRTISKRRYERALGKLAEKGEGIDDLLVASAGAGVAARGAVILAELDARIRKSTRDKKSLDDVARILQTERAPVTTRRFREIAQEVSGRSLRKFFEQRLGR
ncbi:MAG: hypothetical protein P8R42_09255 [Candidatus Binatia bacterium]|nr:hypothetical protein [Candidatus Binatia bacterium]